MMSELERLTEDLRAYDASMGLIRKRYPELDHVQPTPAIVEAARAYRDLLANGHRHVIEGGFIIHKDHDLGAEAKALDPIPFEGHQHLVVLMERNYVNEVSGPALSVYPKEAEDE